MIYNNTDKSQIINYKETRHSPFLDNASDWEVAVCRFSIPTTAVPLFIWEPNIYYVAVEYGGVWGYSEVQLVYPNNDSTDNTTKNYVYNYQLWIDNVNHALELAVNDAHLIIQPPVILYDENNISTIAPYNGGFEYYPFDLSNPQGIKVYFSRELFLQFFASLDNQYFVNPQGEFPEYNLQYLIRFFNHTNNYYGLDSDNKNTKYPSLDYAVVENKNQYPITFSWTKVRRILLQTASFQINPEFIGADNSGTPYFQQILTDFELPYDNAPLNRTTIFYQPAVFRYISITTEGPLREFDIQLFYQTYNDLELRYLILPPKHDINIKLQFRKKKIQPLYKMISLLETLIKQNENNNKKENKKGGYQFLNKRDL